MLDQGLKKQVTDLFSALSNEYTLLAKVSNNHKNKTELVELLKDVSTCSPKVNFVEEDGEGLEFSILKNGRKTDILFKAVPNGHEFSTLLVAILNMDGIGKNLPDDAIADQIRNLKGKVHLKSFISLTCTNCPQVVQALNVMAMLNPNITHEIVDGALHQAEAEKLGIQAVPSVFANNEQVHVGRSSLGELLGKIQNLVGSTPKQVSSEVKKYDVIVVGGGPAGVSAAVYSARKGFSVAIVAQKVGGQVTETVSIENMIGTPKTTGAQLSADLMKHAKDYPIDILENRLVQNMDVVNGEKEITTSLGEKFISPALIIATGASWRKLGVPGEADYIGAGVAFCTHCDGPFYKGKKVVVVGGGNSGLEAAIDLSSIATGVTILEFGAQLNGDKILQDKIAALPNVEVITNAQTREVMGDGKKVTALTYKNRENAKIESISTDGIFVQIGLTANSGIFADAVHTNRTGEIEIDAHCRTKQAGIYAAGDVTIVPYKQIVIAMGEGSKAALSAFEDQIKNRLLQN